jgi:hypothetical protein
MSLAKKLYLACCLNGCWGEENGAHWNQREFERRVAMMGGGNFVVPAHC